MLFDLFDYDCKVAECLILMLTRMRECFSRLCESCLPQVDRTGIK